MSRKILVLELWGVGDLTFSTLFIREALAKGDEVHLLAKPYARPLLEKTFPGLKIIGFDAPWTKFTGKYRLWQWNWKELLPLIASLRAEHYDAGVSVRHDPRDHLLLQLCGVRERYGFPKKGSQIFLNRPVQQSRSFKQHRVEDWQDLAVALGFADGRTAAPALNHAAYRSERISQLLGGAQKPVICLHTGARIAVRRWPETYFAAVLKQLRAEFDFHLVLVPDPDGYGSGLAGMADAVATDLNVTELVDILGRASVLLCNDSAPAHLAAACGRSAIAIFGPTDPDWFRPWGEDHRVIIRDLCEYRPCFDYCRFPEPYCMTKLHPEDAYPEIREHLLTLIRTGKLSGAICLPGHSAI